MGPPTSARPPTGWEGEPAHAPAVARRPQTAPKRRPRIPGEALPLTVAALLAPWASLAQPSLCQNFCVYHVVIGIPELAQRYVLQC